MKVQSASGENLPAVAPGNHGRTVAAWVTNGGIVLGATLAAVGIALPAAPVLWAGVAVIVLALILGGVLKAMGHGQPSH